MLSILMQKQEELHSNLFKMAFTLCLSFVLCAVWHRIEYVSHYIVYTAYAFFPHVGLP